ncbi:endocuticle structural glycoprotein SgAbd-8-like [Ischnura elegans]|uniref:endocuticle structural glycoprotein SgAbd-8-like n=1 Tax=Ischnura elegans TaxID=197161 RepID=UPI001ED89F11|nr:endocuticle structural glycoprotein SgAbd-8-like [Ischnura elegans]
MRGILLLSVLLISTTTARPPRHYPRNLKVRVPAEEPQGIGRLKRKPVELLSMTSDFNPDGSAHYSYETEDGTKVEQVGQVRDFGDGIKGYVAHGAYEFIATDGRKYRVTYTADENGFQPKGAHLPISPPYPGTQAGHHSGPRSGAPPGKYRGGEGGREGPPDREEEEDVEYDEESVITA